jgi:hypothetical protein
MHRTSLSVLAAVLGAAAAAALAAPFQASAAGCTPGTRTIGGAPARVFCGSAHATVQLGARKLTFSGGSCERLGSSFALNIGTLSFATASKLPYLGISLTGARAGRQTRPTVSFNAAGKRSSLQITTGLVTLAKGLKSGTFAGRTLAGATVKGSFSC